MIKQAEYIKSFVDVKDIPSDGFLMYYSLDEAMLESHL